MTDTRTRVRALFVSLLMVTSVFAGAIAATGTVAATHQGVSTTFANGDGDLVVGVANQSVGDYVVTDAGLGGDIVNETRISLPDGVTVAAGVNLTTSGAVDVTDVSVSGSRQRVTVTHGAAAAGGENFTLEGLRVDVAPDAAGGLDGNAGTSDTRIRVAFDSGTESSATSGDVAGLALVTTGLNDDGSTPVTAGGTGEGALDLRVAANSTRAVDATDLVANGTDVVVTLPAASGVTFDASQDLPAPTTGIDYANATVTDGGTRLNVPVTGYAGADEVSLLDLRFNATRSAVDTSANVSVTPVDGTGAVQSAELSVASPQIVVESAGSNSTVNVTAIPDETGAAATHRVDVTVGDNSAGDTLNDVVVDYSVGSAPANVSDVDLSDVRVATLNGGDVSTDLQSVSASNNGETVTFTFGGNNALSANDTIVLEYDGVTNPSTAGDSAVDVLVNSQSDPIDTSSTNVTYADAPATPAFLAVSNLSAPANATTGDTIAVDATITNTGETAATNASVAFRLDADGNGSFTDGGDPVVSQTVSLDASATTDVSFDVNTTGLQAGTYTHGVFTANDSRTASLTIENATPEVATVGFDDKTVDGSAGSNVTVEAAFLPDGGFVVLHNTTVLTDGSNPNAAVDSIVGVSDVLSAGNASNVSVTLSEDIASGSYVAMPHRDTNDNGTYDFPANTSQDVPYFNNATPSDGAVIDAANLTVQQATPEVATVGFDDKTIDGSAGSNVTVEAAFLPDGGFLVLHNQTELQNGSVVPSIVGASEVQPAGNVSNVNVTLDENISSGTYVAMPHRDTNGNGVYDFPANTSQDVPYFNNATPSDGAVIDPANLTVENASGGADEFPNGIPGVSGTPPIDADGDGRFEDVNGDGVTDFTDVIDFLFALDDLETAGLTASQRASLNFDGDSDNVVDLLDVIQLLFDIN